MTDSLPNETVMQFANLFAGRTDAWFDSDRQRAARGRVGLQHFRNHLNGVCPIGTYPVRDDGTCRWGCIDLDKEHESFFIADDIRSAWQYEGITAWVERSRSKGWHIWVFTKQWVPARIMRNAGLLIVNSTEKARGIVNRLSAAEVNPKGDDPKKTRTGLINTVRLPYAGNAEPGRMVVVDHRVMDIPLKEFCEMASGTPANPRILEELSTEWIKSQREREDIKRLGLSESAVHGCIEYGSSAYQKAVAILSGKARATVGERDNQLYTIAKYLHGRSVEFSKALDEMTRVHAFYLDDPDTYPLEQALEKVRRAYGQ